MPRPAYGSGSLPPTGPVGAPPGFINPPPPPSATALKAGGPPSAAGPAGAIPASAFVVGGTLPEKMNTLFIGSIAPGINNIAMEKLLKTTGNFIKWKRVQDPTSQTWKAFGFAEYADADSMLRTLRVLGQDGQQPKGEKPVGLELTAMDGSGTVKALLVKADERTRQFLDQYEEMRPRTIHDTEKDKVALAQAMKVIQQMKDGTLDTSEPEPDDKEDRSREDSAVSKMEAETEEAEISEEQKEHIARELNFFRERAALKEKEKREQEEKAERQRANQHHHREKDTESQSHRSGRERAWGGNSSSGGNTRHMDFVPASGSNQVESSSTSNAGSAAADHDTGVDSEAEEKARQERRERELEHSYKERERRWEQREAERTRLYEKDKARDEDYATEQKAAKEAMAYRYSMWDDDAERERRHEDYYRDRSRWWQRRQAVLQKEERYDALDRDEEKEELEQEAAKKAKAEAAAAAAAAAVEITTPTAEETTVETPIVDHDGDSEMKEAPDTPNTAETSVSTPTASSTPTISTPTRVDPSALPSTILPNQPTKLKLSLSTTLKRGSETSSGSGTPIAGGSAASGFVAANEFGQDDDDEKAVKKRRVLVPLKYSDDEGDSQEQGGNHVNGGELLGSEKEKREQEIKALIQSIPADAQSLWNWPIQWQYVEEDNEQILKEKIQPFASKKVFELLGEEDEELTSFVMDHVRQRKPPQQLVDDLRRALDEDAAVLVMKIWRMLIFETESKARKLSSR
ncbi:hypothetical protein BGX34_008787 [Mortierella sp. NVP85]|nr:hypothetical protein BGX34_008787 [Mortierella sp. NVP85]